MANKNIPLPINQPPAAAAGDDPEKPERRPGVPLQFFPGGLAAPRSREEVRFNKIGFFVYEDKRRVAVGFDITRFLEGPSIEVTITNDRGQPAGALTVIETAVSNFSLTMHLRDQEPTDIYHVKAALYYVTPETERIDVDTYTAAFDTSQPGEQ